MSKKVQYKEEAIPLVAFNPQSQSKKYLQRRKGIEFDCFK